MYRLLPFMFLVLVVWGCKGKNEATAPSQGKPGDMPVAISAFVVAESQIDELATLPGTLLANEELVVKSEIPGRITQIAFKEGAEVTKGQLLFKIFDADLQAQLKKLKVQRDLLQKTLNRQKELQALNGVSAQEYDNTESQLAAVDADIQLMEAQIQKTEIKAPFSARAGLRNVSEGATITVGESLTTLQQVNPLKLDVLVPEKNAARIKAGTKLKFRSMSDSGERVAEVYAIQPGADAQTRCIRVRAITQNQDAKLHPGQYVDVILSNADQGKSLVIPTQSVIPEAKGKKVVRIKGGQAEFVPITIGARTEKYVEVTSGLALGDTVATTGIMKLRPESKVTIKEIVK